MIRRAPALLYVVIPVCLALESCTDSKPCEVPIMKLGATIERPLLEEFGRQEIEHARREDGAICVHYDDAQRASQVLGEVVELVVPRETSQSMEPEVHRRVVATLKKQRIAFAEHMFDGHMYLVWSRSDDVDIRQIIAAEFKKYLGDELRGQ